MSVSSNPIRFGLNPRGMSFERTVEIARLAESAGFEIVSFSDRPPETNLEGWTMATAVAMRTERIRVTHSTLNVPYRYPALLAKMAAITLRLTLYLCTVLMMLTPSTFQSPRLELQERAGLQ